MWVAATPHREGRRTFHLIPPLPLAMLPRARVLRLVDHHATGMVVVVAGIVRGAPVTLALKVTLPATMPPALARITTREDAMLRRVQALRDSLPPSRTHGVEHLVAFHGSERDVPWRRHTATVIAMEYVVGPCLRAVLEEARAPLSRGCVAHYARDVARAVAFLHRHDMIHRDVKLENAVLDCGAQRVVVVDFGFVAPVDGPCTDFPGSPEYAAPEMYAHQPYNGKAADVYAFGVLLHALVARRLPFVQGEAESATDFTRRVMRDPPDLSRVAPCVKPLLRRLLAKDPGRRPDMASVLAATFFAASRKDGDAAPQDLRGGRLARWRH